MLDFDKVGTILPEPKWLVKYEDTECKLHHEEYVIRMVRVLSNVNTHAEVYYLVDGVYIRTGVHHG